MFILIPGSLTGSGLLGPMDARRQLQDSSVLGDIWVEFGEKPNEPADPKVLPHRRTIWM